MRQQSPISIRHILAATFRNLAANDSIRMAGATAFFSTFALPPILMIIVRALSLFADRRTIGRALGSSLRKIFGEDSHASILQTIRSFHSLEHNYVLTTVLFIFLLFVATSLFAVIRKSINQLWNIRTTRGAGVLPILKSRAISDAVILVGGLLFLGIQVAVAGQQMLRQELNTVSATAGTFVGSILSLVVTAVVTAMWLFMLFMLLPDGRVPVRIAMTGAIVSGILFAGGKALLRVLLEPVHVSNFYGVSGAIALVLLFMFYSSIFLYFGAALIGALSDARGVAVLPKRHAEKYRLETMPDCVD